LLSLLCEIKLHACNYTCFLFLNVRFECSRSPFFSALCSLPFVLVSYSILLLSRAQVSFDFLASFLYSLAEGYRHLEDNDGHIKAAITFGAAAITSVLSCVASQPGDVVLTQVYGHGGSSAGVHVALGSNSLPKGGVSLGCVSRKIWQSQGLGGFFVGLRARLYHVGGIITSQLAIYDYVKQGLGLAASGSH